MRVNLRVPVLLAAALSWSSVSACKKSPPPEAPENVERTAFVAQPCPELALGSEPLDATNARVFVEIVDVGAQSLPSPIGRWLDDNAVTFRSSANLIAFPNVPTSAPWAQCVDAVCTDAERSVGVTARLPNSTSEPLELALRIEEGSAESAAPKTLLDTTLRASNQEPVVVASGAALDGGSLIVTTYLLRRFDDLQRILECQERRKARERQP